MDRNLEHLARLVKQVQHRQHRSIDAALSQLNISLVQWDALRAIAGAPQASAHDLAVATFQTDQSFGTLAARLEARRLIMRRPGRGRRIAHRLTALGERTLAAADEIVHAVRASLYAPLSAADRRHLARMLTSIAGS